MNMIPPASCPFRLFSSSLAVNISSIVTYFMLFIFTGALMHKEAGIHKKPTYFSGAKIRLISNLIVKSMTATTFSTFAPLSIEIITLSDLGALPALSRRN